MNPPGIADVSTAVVSVRGVEAPGLVAALTILSHPAAHRVGERYVLDAMAAGREVALSRNAPDFTKPGRVLGASLGDPFVSRNPIRLAPGPGGRVRLFIDAGATPVVAGVPVEGSAEFAIEDLSLGIPLELAERVVLLLHLCEPAAGAAADRLGMVGESAG